MLKIVVDIYYSASVLCMEMKRYMTRADFAVIRAQVEQHVEITRQLVRIRATREAIALHALCNPYPLGRYTQRSFTTRPENTNNQGKE